MGQQQEFKKDGWFSESEVMWPGQLMSLAIDEVLHHEHSGLQDVLVFRSKTYGHVLVLDGVIQLTERDEFAYQEMIAQLPLHAHPCPRRVLIIGGGDGGVLREVCRHACVEEVVMCEIDKAVCDVSKRFFGDTVATSFDDPRVELLHADGAKYLEGRTERPFDVVIVDSSDPVGPAESLFHASFYEKARNALDPKHGVLCTQGECMWLHLPLIEDVLGRCGQVFPTVDYAYTTVPTYPSGQIGFVLCSRDAEAQLSTPARRLCPALADQCRYYTPATHAAAFVLPAFAERAVKRARKHMPLPPATLVLSPAQSVGVVALVAAATLLAVATAAAARR